MTNEATPVNPSQDQYRSITAEADAQALGEIQKLLQPTAAMIEQLKSQQIKIGSGGFIQYVDHMGSDGRIIEAARLTAQSLGKNYGDDRTLLRYLFRHRHTTPVEFCELLIKVRVPMDVWRQWIRHRTASVNEYSTRYTTAIDDKATTPATAWRKQSTSNRQGSSAEFVESEAAGEALSMGHYLTAREQALHQLSDEIYQERLTAGVAKEQARKDLPLSTYTEAYWKIDLHNLIHFLGLRMDAHAQLEIREYATALGEQIVRVLFPETYQAFLDYHFNAVTFSALDVSVLQRIMAELLHDHPLRLDDFINGPQTHPEWAGKSRCRERDEFVAKLAKIGLTSG